MHAKSSRSTLSFLYRIMSVVMLAMLLIAAMPTATAFAQTIGYYAPTTATVNGRNAWTAPTNVFNSDDAYSTTVAKKKAIKLGGFNIAPIQGNSVINGIEVTVEGYQTGRQAKVELSWDGGRTWTSYKPDTNLSGTDAVLVLGGPAVDWGHTWQAYEFTNANFRVKLTSGNGTGALYVDQVQVKIYYSPTNTTLVVPSVHVLYGATEVTLSATLQETVSGLPISGETVNFTFNGLAAGSDVTDADGLATVNVSIVGMNAGVHLDAIRADYVGAAGYQATYTIADLDIQGELVIVQPDAQYRIYGESDPALTFTVTTGSLTPADFTGSLTREAGEEVGDYLISQGTLATINLGYVLIVNENEFLTINPATLAVTTANYSKAVSDDPIVSFAPIYTGFALTDDASVLLTPAVCTVDAALQSIEGPHPILCSGASALNYVFTYTDPGGILTVNADIEPVQRLTSVATQDGWIREGGEFTGRGTRVNAGATTLRIGDDAYNRQYRSIVSFQGIVIPDGATITKVTLQVVYQGKQGTSPFRTHRNLMVDLKIPTFGTPVLQRSDFQAGPSLKAAGIIGKTPVSVAVYQAQLLPAAVTMLNTYNNTATGGLTQLQLRLRFQRQDNNDFGADFLKFYSGNSTLLNSQPVLIIEYTMP